MKKIKFFKAFQIFIFAAFAVYLQAQNPVPQIGHADFGYNEKAVLTPSGELLITGGADGAIKIWERNGLLLNTIPAHDSQITALAVSEDGNRLLSAGTDDFIKLWDIETGSKLKSFPVNGDTISYIAFDSKSNFFATAGISTTNGKKAKPKIKIWSFQSGKSQLEFECDYYTSVLFSPQSDYVAFKYQDSVKVVSLSTGEIFRTFSYQGYSDNFSFSSDGKKILVHSSQYNKSNKLTFWDIVGNYVLSEKDGTGFWGILPDWKTIVFNIDKSIVVKSADTDRVVNTFQLPRGSANDVLPLAEISFNDNKINFIFNNFGSGWKIVTANGKGVGFETGRTEIAKRADHATGLAFSKNGKRLAWGSFGLVFLWDVENNSLINVMAGHSSYVNEIIFSPDGNYLLSCGRFEVKVWSSRDGSFIRNILDAKTSKSNLTSANTATFSSDGKLVAVSDVFEKTVKKDETIEESGIRIIDFESGRLLRRIINPSPPDEIANDIYLRDSNESIFQPVSFNREASYERGETISSIRFLKFSPNGKFLASVDDNNYIRFWNPLTGRLIKTFPKQKGIVNSVDFSGDGKRLVTGGFDDTIKIWNAATGAISRTLDAGDEGGTTVRFSSDGQNILSGGYDGTVRIWNSNLDSQPVILENHSGKISSLAVNPANTFFATAGTDGKINFWSLPDKRLIVTLLAFPDKEWLTFTPEGFYKGSASAEKYLAWRDGNKTFASNNSTKARFSKPEIIASRFNGNFSNQNNVGQIPTESKDLSVEKVKKLPSKEKRWALIVGVDNYGLKGAANDAKALKETLVKYAGFPEEQVILLTTDGSSNLPSRKNILTELDILSRTVPKDGLFLFSFSGHGKTIDKNAYLVPSDGELIGNYKLLRDFWIDVQRVKEAIGIMEVQQVILMLDACRDIIEARGSRSSPLTSEMINGFSFDEANKSIKASVTFYATQEGDLSYEYFDNETGQHRGFFSRAIEEGLSGKAANQKGEVTLAALMKYVEDVVPKRSFNRLSIKQIPRNDSNNGYGQNDLILSVVK